MKTKLVTLLLFAVTIVQAQENFYEAIEANGEASVYEGFSGFEANGDGTYNFVSSSPAVNITVTKLPTGQPVGFVATPVSEDYGGFSETEISDYGRVDSYPNVISIKHDYTDDGYMMIDDLLFKVDKIPDNGVPKFNNVIAIYVMVKERGETKEKEDTVKKKTKKKGGFMARMKAKIESAAGGAHTPTYKYIKTVKIEKVFNDYIIAMKSKQATALTAEDKADIARIKRTREAGDEEIKRYNDSIRATPEYTKLKAHQARMAQMDKNDAKNEVMVYNKTGKDIYFVEESSRNPTKISSGTSTKLNCSKNYYYTYDANDGIYGGRSNHSKLYSSNSGCGSGVTVN
ncbi:MAG: hypothetical protein ACJA1H_002546 [Glaciecola sp.]|jgi:hypothetical protein